MSQRSWERLFALVWAALLVNLNLTAALSPLLLALALVADPLGSWPFFLLLSGLCGPALTGAFACFADPDATSTRLFWSTWRRTAVTATTTWLTAAALVTILFLDARFLLGTRWGPALALFFTSATTLVTATALAVLTHLAAGSAAPRLLLRPCLVGAARRWWLSLASTTVLLTTALFVLAAPLPGLLLAASPLLYAAWTQTRLSTLTAAHPTPAARHR
ncbi:hypothetical protein [Actinosynnema pretiosum]|uniref:hypothetical protein n=1 Tax=Actinosynnema pretiosum TaxID=42197 RepID=UPI0012FE42DA|nr:hypothetical protein [Actinosynnema pretiosum]